MDSRCVSLALSYILVLKEARKDDERADGSSERHVKSFKMHGGTCTQIHLVSEKKKKGGLFKFQD